MYIAPPKVAEKPVRTAVEPDKLSFKEKLALHKRTLEEQASEATRAPPPLSHSREGYRRSATPDFVLTRTESPISVGDNTTQGSLID